MRRAPLFLGLLLASSAVLAQDDGVLIFKSEQPYVSPFDKAPSGRPAAPAAALFPPHEAEAPRGEKVEMPVQEMEKTAPVVKPVQRAPVRRAEPPRKKENTKPFVAKAEPAKAVVLKDAPADAKVAPVKSDSNIAASVIPPQTAQNPKPELAPPPTSAVKENGLTSFGKVAPAASTPAMSIPTQIGPTAVVSAEVTQLEKIEEPVNAVATESTGIPTWVLKAFLFFIIGGLLMAGAWYWIKRQALYGDPAFQDPWFHPIKGR